MSVRSLVARTLGPLIVWPLAKRLTASEPRALMYHRFSFAPTPRRTDANLLRSHLEIISSRYEPVTFSELARRIESGDLDGGRPPVAITVDDGYRDFHTHALPVLRSVGVPATIFVSAGFVEERLWMWPDALEYLLFSSRKMSAQLEFRGKTLQLDLSSPERRRNAWIEVGELVQFDTKGRAELLPLLEQALALQLPERTTPEYEAMTWDEVRDVANNGVEIGGHTWSHAFLPDLSPEQLKFELHESRALIEREIGRRVTTFAYPNGLEQDATDGVRDAVAQAGFHAAAVATKPIPRAAIDPFRIGRWSACDDLVNLQNVLSGASSLVARFAPAN